MKGQPVGCHRTFAEDGILQERRLYHSPKKFDSKRWDKDGNLILEGVFKSSVIYEEKNWIHGTMKKRRGFWKKGYIFWEKDGN